MRKDILNRKEEIINLYNQEVSPYKISYLMKCDLGTIKRLLNKEGIKLRSQYEYIKGRIPKNKIFLDNEKINKIISLYKKGISGHNIAKNFGYSSTVVYRILRENIQMRNGGHIKGTMNPKQSQTMKRLYKEEKIEPWNKRRFIQTNTGRTHFKKGFKPWNVGLSSNKQPNWQDGRSFEPYGLEFNNKFKRAIRKRENQICMLCGIHRERLNRALDIHHIDGDKKMSIPQNCISLCIKCHLGIVHANKNKEEKENWTKFFQSLLSERYDYQYSETGEIILELNNKIIGV